MASLRRRRTAFWHHIKISKEWAEREREKGIFMFVAAFILFGNGIDGET